MRYEICLIFLKLSTYVSRHCIFLFATPHSVHRLLKIQIHQHQHRGRTFRRRPVGPGSLKDEKTHLLHCWSCFQGITNGSLSFDDYRMRSSVWTHSFSDHVRKRCSTTYMRSVHYLNIVQFRGAAEVPVQWF